MHSHLTAFSNKYSLFKSILTLISSHLCVDHFILNNFKEKSIWFPIRVTNWSQITIITFMSFNKIFSISIEIQAKSCASCQHFRRPEILADPLDYSWFRLKILQFSGIFRPYFDRSIDCWFKHAKLLIFFLLDSSLNNELQLSKQP